MADYKKKEEKKPDPKEQIKAALDEVKKLETYALKNRKDDAYGSVMSYMHASQILYGLAEATKDPKYTKLAEGYKQEAEKYCGNAVKELDEKGQETKASELLSMVNPKKAEAYAKKLEKDGNHGEAGWAYLLGGNLKKATEMAQYALKSKQTVKAARIINALVKIDMKEAGIAEGYEQKAQGRRRKQRIPEDEEEAEDQQEYALAA